MARRAALSSRRTSMPPPLTLNRLYNKDLTQQNRRIVIVSNQAYTIDDDLNQGIKDES